MNQPTGLRQALGLTVSLGMARLSLDLQEGRPWFTPAATAAKVQP